ILDRLARFWGSLSQGSEANRVTFCGYFVPLWGPFQRIPGSRLADLVLRLAAAKANINGSGRQFRVVLNAAGIKIASGKLGLDFGAQWVIPDSGGDECML